MNTTLRDEIVGHLRGSIERAPLVIAPFAHVNFDSALPERVYASILASLPPSKLYEPADMKKYGTPDGRCLRDVLDLAPALDRLPDSSRELWTAIHAALASDELRRSVCGKLGIEPKGFAVPRLVHDRPGYWIEPHPDSRAKYVTMQLYLAPDSTREELGTVLYRLSPFRTDVVLGRKPVMERAGQFAFRPNSGYAFAVRWNSFHGVERIADDAGDRHSLMNIYYRREQRRT